MRRRSESEPDSQPEREEETLAMPRSPSRCHLLGHRIRDILRREFVGCDSRWRICVCLDGFTEG